MTKLFSAALLGALVLTSGAGASETEAETCLRTKVWDGYSDGWGIRTMTSADLEAGKTKNFLVTLYKGNEYRIATCGDQHVTNLDVLLYDTQGNVITRDTTTDREPVLEYTPQETGTYYIVVYLRELDGKKPQGGTAMAVVYR